MAAITVDFWVYGGGATLRLMGHACGGVGCASQEVIAGGSVYVNGERAAEDLVLDTNDRV